MSKNMISINVSLTLSWRTKKCVNIKKQTNKHTYTHKTKANKNKHIIQATSLRISTFHNIFWNIKSRLHEFFCMNSRFVFFALFVRGQFCSIWVYISLHFFPIFCRFPRTYNICVIIVYNSVTWSVILFSLYQNFSVKT